MARLKIDRRGRTLLAAALAGTLFLSGCGDDDKAAAPPPAASTPSENAPASTGSSAPSANTFDLNGDGEADKMCGTQDFGGGLVLQIPCDADGYANGPPDDTRLVKDSLFRLPGYEADLTDISGSLVSAPDPAGKRVVIVVFNSDNLFETGSDQINSQNTMDATIRLINKLFAGSTIQVRGHTDSTGSASANQGLSERRAVNVRAYLTGNGVKAASVTSIGFGSTRPLVEDTNEEGRKFNRRVEIVLRLP